MAITGQGVYLHNLYNPGNVKRILSTPCNINAALWVESAVPALTLAAITSIFYPDLKHAYHGLTGESVGSSIGKALGGEGIGGGGFGRQISQEVGPIERQELRMKPGGLRGIATYLALLDVERYYAYLANLSSDTVTEWQTIAFEMAGCTTGNRGSGSGCTFVNGACNYDEWFTAGTFSYTGNDGQTYGTDTEVSAVTGQALSLSFSISYVGLDGTPAISGQQITDGSGVIQYDFDTCDPDTQPTDIAAVTWYKTQNETLELMVLNGQASLLDEKPFNVAVGTSGAASMTPLPY